jgi:hypothetical protein
MDVIDTELAGPPVPGALRSPMPMYIRLTWAGFTPANRLRGIFHSVHWVASTHALLIRNEGLHQILGLLWSESVLPDGTSANEGHAEFVARRVNAPTNEAGPVSDGDTGPAVWFRRRHVKTSRGGRRGGVADADVIDVEPASPGLHRVVPVAHADV